MKLHQHRWHRFISPYGSTDWHLYHNLGDTQAVCGWGMERCGLPGRSGDFRWQLPDDFPLRCCEDCVDKYITTMETAFNNVVAAMDTWMTLLRSPRWPRRLRSIQSLDDWAHWMSLEIIENGTRNILLDAIRQLCDPQFDKE